MTHAEDRRSEPRVANTYQITFECFQRGAKIAQGIAQTVDISENGALVEMPCAVDLNASLILSINGPFYMLVVEGDVVHSRQISPHAYRVGVRLTNAIEGNWDHLKMDVHRLLKDILNEG